MPSPLTEAELQEKMQAFFKLAQELTVGGDLYSIDMQDLARILGRASNGRPLTQNEIENPR